MNKFLAIFALSVALATTNVASAMNTTMTPPEGYNDFIENNPELAYTKNDKWKKVDFELLKKVNREKNKAPYLAEELDRWGVGSDCEDYAIEKIKALMGAGVPRGAMKMSLTEVGGNGHVVLLINGKYVLDNLSNKIFYIGDYPSKIIAWEEVGDEWTINFSIFNLINQ